jgi:hypothetical protein
MPARRLEKQQPPAVLPASLLPSCLVSSARFTSRRSATLYFFLACSATRFTSAAMASGSPRYTPDSPSICGGAREEKEEGEGRRGGVTLGGEGAGIVGLRGGRHSAVKWSQRTEGAGDSSSARRLASLRCPQGWWCGRQGEFPSLPAGAACVPSGWSGEAVQRGGCLYGSWLAWASCLSSNLYLRNEGRGGGEGEGEQAKVGGGWGEERRGSRPAPARPTRRLLTLAARL